MIYMEEADGDKVVKWQSGLPGSVFSLENGNLSLLWVEQDRENSKPYDFLYLHILVLIRSAWCEDILNQILLGAL
jgi:hypothetical protein